jgi:glycosyltransferase involved in cell wall biosynthesis/nucleotide-binding universal stress UspA family protein
MQMADDRIRRRVVVAGTSGDEVARLLPFARVLSQALHQEVIVLGLVMVPEGTSLSAGALPAQKLRVELEAVTREVEAQTSVRVAHLPWSEAQVAVGDEACDLLLVNWDSALPEDALRAMPCDVVVVNGSFPSQVRRILLPIRGGPYAALALEVALAFAQVHSAEITLLHAVSAEELNDEIYQEFLRHLRVLPQITRWINIRGDAVKAIVRSIGDQDHQLLVMGAIAKPQPGDPPIGPTATRVMKQAGIPSLIVKTRRAFPSRSQELALLPPIDYTISVVVDKWFAENSFHGHEFEDVKRLVEMKERQGVTISLGLPALNEEYTIGKVIKTVRQTFVQDFPLLDEIVVIDSNSTDETVAIAQDLGVPVYRHPEILPQYGTYVGKGEALWKSLYVLKGDLIAWVDTDILNIHPRFVYGILGPLLKEQRLMYVKGFYQRPLRLARKVEARGGGRVTELVARPLLNLFYPELSGLVQPLAGEYAGRRKALERIPFFTGYGVETGMLIDILECFGLNAIGQVDLEERVHRNQALTALSKMAFAIIQVVMQRVGNRRKIELLDWMNASMKLIRYEPDQFRLDIHEIRDLERPPMVKVPEYQSLYHTEI